MIVAGRHHKHNALTRSINVKTVGKTLKVKFILKLKLSEKLEKIVSLFAKTIFDMKQLS